MKKILWIVALAVLSTGGIRAQEAKAVKATVAPSPAPAVKVPPEYSAKLAEIQEQAKKLDTDYAQVIALFKEYIAKRDALQAQAAVLATRAALAAHMTIEQLDNSMLTVDEKGHYQWVRKANPDGAKSSASPLHP